MQSDTPQGDPRLQKTDPGPTIATGIVDPCIVYLETTLPGEIPLIAACWASSSQEIKLPGQQTCFELTNLLILQNNAFAKNAPRNLWRIHARREKKVYLLIDAKAKRVKCSYVPETFAQAPAPAFQWSVRYIDGQSHAAFHRFKDMTCLARLFFIDSKLNWQSVQDFIAETRNGPRKTSIVSRLLKTVFKKKQQPVAA